MGRLPWGDGMTSRFRSWVCLALMLALSGLARASEPGAEEIIRRSLEVTQADWAAAPRYSRIERDEDTRGDTHTVKTYRILMLEGSPYQRLIALDDEPLSAGQQAREQRKLRQEIVRRANESPAARARRLAQFHKNRQRMFLLMREMTEAFDFTLRGRERLEGRDTWILDATPRPGYQPPSREAKVLKAMEGTLWIDCQNYQWVKVEAKVLKPVWFGWCIAKVAPGTRFLLEQAPVSEGLWLPEHFRVSVRASVLWFRHDFVHDETYKDYRLIPSKS